MLHRLQGSSSLYLPVSLLLLLAFLGGSRPAMATTCANAIVINPASLPITNQALVCGTTNDLNSGNVPGDLCVTFSWYDYKDGNEALYRFTPATTAPYQISYNGQSYSSIMVYNGCPTGNNCIYGLGDYTTSKSITVTLTAGITYYIWFDTWPSPNSPCPGTFSIGPPPPPPANDECANAVALTVNPDYSCGTVTAGTVTNSTASSPGSPCGGTADDDVWFKFTATTTQHRVSLINITGGTTDMMMAIYRGTACNALTNIACSDPETADLTGLTIGQTYYVRVYTWSATGYSVDFNICVGTPPPPPANDECANAVALTVNPDYNCGTVTAGTITSATASSPASPCGGTADDDVWFKFTATATQHRVSLININGGTTDMMMAIYRGTACNALTNIACTDPETINLTGLTIGQTYYVRVYTWSSTRYSVNFNVCVGTPPPPPGCGSMWYDTGGPNGNYDYGEDYTMTFCPDNPGETVTLIFDSFRTEATYDFLEVYNGPNTGSPLLGTFSGTALPPILSSSHSSGCLTIRFKSDGSVNYDGWSAMILCQPIPTGDCIYALILEDSGGNGWGSSRVGVRINGGAWAYYTVTGSTNVALIGVNLGDLVELNYDASGPNQNQNRYSISKLGQAPYFTSNQPPEAGTTFSQIVSCGPPPSPPQDCAGGITVCSSLAITNTATNWGETQDLNSSNQGCLSYENMGSWYFFSPQTAGTIGFSITPHNTYDDYDFAVWGPYTTAHCPTGPPLRCSWNAPPSYVVGLGNGATDLSEGASGDGWVKTIDAQAGEVYVLYVDNWSASGQAFTLDWNLNTGTSLDCTPLPIELLDLDAQPRKKMVDVLWATASETNTKHYEVQRSPDNQHWKHIGTVTAAGNSQFRTDYLFVDEDPLPGISYYRLNQVDQDQASSLTHAVVVYLSTEGGKPQLYPNPATDQLRVAFHANMAGDVRFHITDATGRIVSGTALPMATGDQNAELPIGHLAKGWYSLRILLPDGSTMQTVGFMKQ